MYDSYRAHADEMEVVNKFPVGTRMRHKETGEIWIRGYYKTKFTSWMMRLNPS